MRVAILISAALLGGVLYFANKDSRIISGMTPFVLAILMGLAKSGTA